MAEHLGFWIREWPSPSSRPSPWGFGGGTTVPEVEEVVLHPGTHRQTLPRQLPSRANPIGPILFDGAAPWTTPTGEERQSDAFGSSAAYCGQFRVAVPRPVWAVPWAGWVPARRLFGVPRPKPPPTSAPCAGLRLGPSTVPRPPPQGPDTLPGGGRHVTSWGTVHRATPSPGTI